MEENATARFSSEFRWKGCVELKSGRSVFFLKFYFNAVRFNAYACVINVTVENRRSLVPTDNGTLEV